MAQHEQHAASKASQEAMHEADAHNLSKTSQTPVPAAEEGGHARSHAAHLGTADEPHTKPEGNLRQGSAPGELREPPQGRPSR